ncbi:MULTISPECIES: hypothetical protein [Pontibacillus]|uniref:ATP-binding sugar transporter Gifsy-2 n=1 Tax=Pontibacillus chungwhensis TaxID=265426 RepID=A0ABY8UYI9_9BACI|nr:MULTISPECIES: hypothetical protein [Pontibacillus]MCD5324772.1 hypothetical protein [Pontibacillus sp. HN14]WIF98732.1 hypothetical protein QNI29_03510 [Pontibacillus chungwhensis]
MSAFREMLESDISIFMDIDEFGIETNINGEFFTVVMDEEEMVEGIERPGIYMNKVAFYIRTNDIPKPYRGERMIFDEEDYYVDSVVEHDGLYRVVLEVLDS